MQYQELTNILKQYGDISAKEEELIEQYFKPLSLKKYELFKSNSPNNIIFVTKGLLRAFIEDEKGGIYTRIIAWENRFITNIVNFKQFKSSNETIEAIEPSEILYTNKDLFYELLESQSNLNLIYLKILSEYHELYIKKYNLYASKSLQEKMIFLKRNFPQFIKRCNDSILASFLGISRESFVRGKAYL